MDWSSLSLSPAKKMKGRRKMMVRGKGTKKILSYSERQGLEDAKKEAVAVLKESQEPGVSRGVDQSAIKREIAHLDREIHEGTAPNIRGASKDRLASRSQELKAKIEAGMPSRFEMDHPAKSPGAVQKHMRWSQRNKEAIKEYKQIQRNLNPDAPVNIESFRKDK